MAVSLPSVTTVASGILELVESGVADPEMVGDLVIDRVRDPAASASGVREERTSGPRKRVILLGTAAASAP